MMSRRQPEHKGKHVDPPLYMWCGLVPHGRRAAADGLPWPRRRECVQSGPMIIDIHGHYTTAPPQLREWRLRQIDSAGTPFTDVPAKREQRRLKREMRRVERKLRRLMR